MTATTGRSGVEGRKKLRLLSYPFEHRVVHASPLFHSNACYQIAAYLRSVPAVASDWAIDVTTFEGQAFWERGSADEDNYDVLRELLADSPDVLGFSLYLWNVEPLYDLMRVAKQIRPDLLMVAGGPEVFDRPDFARAFPAFDVLVEGDGEEPMKTILERLARGEGLEGIPNVSYRLGGEWVHGRKARITTDQNAIPDYFATSKELIYGRAFYLSTRGCTHGCDYCLWARQAMSRKSRDRVIRDLESLMVGTKLKSLTLYDYDLVDIYRGDKELFEALSSLRARAHPEFQFSFFVSPNNLSDPMIRDILGAFSVHTVFVGLQSFNEQTLAAVNRPWSVVQGSPFESVPFELRCRFLVELVFPMPGETVDSYLSAVRYLLGQGYYRFHPFGLLLLRGTRLHRDRDKLGLKCLERAPYLCIETALVPFEGVMRMGVLGRVLTLLAEAAEYMPEHAVAFSAYCRDHGELTDEILSAIDGGEDVRAIAQRLVERVVGKGYVVELRRAAGATNADYWDTQLSRAQRPRGSGRQMAPPVAHQDAFEKYFEEAGVVLGAIRRTGHGLQFELDPGESAWTITLAPGKSNAPAFQTTRHYRVAYSGAAATLSVVEGFVDLVRRLEGRS